MILFKKLNKIDMINKTIHYIFCRYVVFVSILFLEKTYNNKLSLQVAFYEILNGLWVRNGLQIKGQAMTYIQCNFCNSMVDADLYLLQICCTRVNTERFINMVIDQ